MQNKNPLYHSPNNAPISILFPIKNDLGKDKGSPVYNGIYDQFLEVDLKDLGNISEKVRKARKKISSTEGSKKSTGSKKQKVVVKKNNISKSFTTLFGSEEEDF